MTARPRTIAELNAKVDRTIGAIDRRLSEVESRSAGAAKPAKPADPWADPWAAYASAVLVLRVLALFSWRPVSVSGLVGTSAARTTPPDAAAMSAAPRTSTRDSWHPDGAAERVKTHHQNQPHSGLYLSPHQLAALCEALGGCAPVNR